MSDTQAQWDDTRINARINDILTKYHHTPRGLARRVAYEVRDDLTARLAAAEAERDLYKSQAGLLEDNGRLVAWRMVNAEARVKELEQELAEAQTMLEPCLVCGRMREMEADDGE